MKEVLFKNLTSEDASRKLLSMSETTSQDGMNIMTYKRCTYRLKKRIRISDLHDFKEYDENKQPQKKHFYIIKKRDSRTGEEKLFCGSKGILYIVAEDYLYHIAFTNLLKVNMKNAKAK